MGLLALSMVGKKFEFCKERREKEERVRQREKKKSKIYGQKK